MMNDSSPSNTTGKNGTNINPYTVVTVIIFCIIFVAGTLGNGLVIYVTGFRMKKTVNSVWFLNLALADFLFTAFLIFSIISLSQEKLWPFGNFMCILNTFVTVVNMFASIFLLTAISLDRCLAIWVVVWAQNKRTVRKAQLICAVIWVFAVACSAPCATFRQTVVRKGKVYCDPDKKKEWILINFRFIIGFLIPFLVIFVSYVAIGIRAGRLQRKRKNRSRKIISSVILAFFFCWVPFHIVQLISLNTDQPLLKIISPLTVCLAFLNSCLNPILYVFMCDEFQEKLKQSICFVLESALAEDHLSFTSCRSLSSHLSRTSRKSECAAALEDKSTVTSSKFTEERH